VIFNRLHYFISTALAICALLETVALTYMQTGASHFYYSSSILYFISGMAVCVLPLIALPAENKEIKNNKVGSRYGPYVVVLLYFFFIAYELRILCPLYRLIPIDKSIADMIPTISIACHRLLDGQTVYGPAPQIWPDSVIQYLPLMWMPFLPAALLNFDFRWITFTAQTLGIALILIPMLKAKKGVPLLPLGIAIAGLYLLLNFFVVKNVTYWSMTEEGVVAAFYLLLSFALLRRNYWLIGVAITGCTLSRYSLIFWIPVYFAFVFLTKNRGEFWKLLLSYSVSMLALFILPFFIKTPNYFIHITDTYTRYVPLFWKSFYFDKHLCRNVGFFKFFKLEHLHTMFILETVTSFAAPLMLLIAAQWWKKRYGINERYVAWASLKICLIFFFGFIQMPFMYVFVPLTIISYALMFDYLCRPQGAGEALYK
jgi:hypothetical protein